MISNNNRLCLDRLLVGIQRTTFYLQARINCLHSHSGPTLLIRKSCTPSTTQQRPFHLKTIQFLIQNIKGYKQNMTAPISVTTFDWTIGSLSVQHQLSSCPAYDHQLQKPRFPKLIDWISLMYSLKSNKILYYMNIHSFIYKNLPNSEDRSELFNTRSLLTADTNMLQNTCWRLI